MNGKIKLMKRLDFYLRTYRQRVIERYVPKMGGALFDIGCEDGNLMHKMAGRFKDIYGCDPDLSSIDIPNSQTSIEGRFPEALEKVPVSLKFDVFTALAVFEHMPTSEIKMSGRAISERLDNGGLLIATVPSPVVDHILHILMFLKLVDGQEAHQHYGFVPKDLIDLFAGELQLIVHKKFQLGLNNIFVFGKDPFNIS